MRTVSIDVPVTVVSEVIKKGVKQEVLTKVEDSRARRIEVLIGIKTSEGELIREDSYKIEGDKYDLLMSESPEFAPGKPLDEYRESDLFYVIDLMQSES